MGLAIINELLKPVLTSSFIEALQNEEDPLKAIYMLMYDLLIKNEFLKVEFGCPAANFTHEITPWNSEFAIVLNELTREWIKLMTASISTGKKKGYVRKEVNVKQVFLIL